MSTNDEKVSQIQTGGLQPSDDLTWNDPFQTSRIPRNMQHSNRDKTLCKTNLSYELFLLKLTLILHC